MAVAGDVVEAVEKGWTIVSWHFSCRLATSLLFSSVAH